jgi:hypothetical protein
MHKRHHHDSAGFVSAKKSRALSGTNVNYFEIAPSISIENSIE